MIRLMIKLRIFTPVGLFQFVRTLWSTGTNAMFILQYAAKMYKHNTALVDDEQELTYEQLFQMSMKLAYALRGRYGIKKGEKVAIICRNHSFLVCCIFAVSRLGGSVFLFNPEMKQQQLQTIFRKRSFAYVIHDDGIQVISLNVNTQTQFLSRRILTQVCEREKNDRLQTRLSKAWKSEIVVMTGGTTGQPKSASHKPSVFKYLPPYVSFIFRLNLLTFQTMLIATPIYFGFGFASMILFLSLGRKVIVMEKFSADKACSLVQRHQVQCITAVPLMIHRMLKQSNTQLGSLQCIACGGSQLSSKLVADVTNRLGDVVYNCYGTSEAGTNMIATPQDLKLYPGTIGKPFPFSKVAILNDDGQEVRSNEVGEIYIKNSWSKGDQTKRWIATGDLGYRNERNYFFFKGRKDDVIVSAGQNIFSLELEQLIANHGEIEDVAVIGIPDLYYGQRIKVFVVLKEKGIMSAKELLDWLALKVTPIELPKEVEFVHSIPYTALGKKNKRQLSSSSV